MRLWHYELLPYLPELQFKGQLRELVLIMRQWRDKGKTNHLLINKVMEYSPKELYYYFSLYEGECFKRYKKTLDRYEKEFIDFSYNHKPSSYNSECFEGWHNKEYLRVCMANLYEKHFFGVGKSRITDAEWETLCRGYKQITGEEYQI
jgi:uncharacterized protein (TIGR02328 family)